MGLGISIFSGIGEGNRLAARKKMCWRLGILGLGRFGSQSFGVCRTRRRELGIGNLIGRLRLCDSLEETCVRREMRLLRLWSAEGKGLKGLRNRVPLLRQI